MFTKNIIKKWLLRIVVFYFASTIGVVIFYKFVPVYLTPLMITRLFDQHAEGKELKLNHTWVPLEEISRNLPTAVMASEDAKFLTHNGFDFDEIKKAAHEAQTGKRHRGASTISQQTAKNVFLWNGHSWIRKGLEVYFTVLIEFIWGKERIMEVYLNSIEMGDGIYGAQAVATENFGRDAAKLTKSQSALIAATLPNPLKFNSAAPSSYMLKRQRAIRRNMKFVSDHEMGCNP